MTSNILSKACSKCGEVKASSEFRPNSKLKSGLHSQCRSCCTANTKAWTIANPDKAKKGLANWYLKNAEKVKAYSAAWYAANPERARRKKAENKAANPEKYRAAIAAWQAANQDKVKASRIAWIKANPEAVKMMARNRRARVKNAAGKLSRGLAEKLFKLQRGKCTCCKLPLGNDYHMDHIIPLVLGGTNTDDNIQLLRAKCNNQKYAKHPVDFMQERGYLL
jgi:5-methylcytosine-specific restriction endonuclease McrA